MRTILVSIVLAVAGCSADDLLDDLADAGLPPADAPPLPEGDFTCLDQPWPTTAPDPITVTGRVIDPPTLAGIVGAAIDILDADDLTVLASGTTVGSPDPGSRGFYSISVPTGGTAPRLVRRASQLGRLDGYYVDPAVTSQRFAVALNIFSETPEERDTYAQVLGYTTDPSAGQLWVFVLDCSGIAVGGATISVPGAEGIGYIAEDFSVGSGNNQTETAAESGGAVAINVPPGTVDVTVTVGGLTYRSWPALVIGGAVTMAPRLP